MALLEVKNVSKSFPPVKALDSISMHVDEFEVVGIVGENGAGKSTLLNIISGVFGPDSGSVFLDGQPIQPKSYREANLLGIWRAFQETALIPGLAMYENMFWGHEDRFLKWGVFLDTGAMIREAEHIVREMGLNVNVKEPTYRYGFSERQAIEVAKAMLVSEALEIRSAFILLDEPTTGLTQVEVSALLSLIKKLRQRASVIFVSHRLTEVLEVADRIYILKDGVVVDHLPANEATQEVLHSQMVGRARDADYYCEDTQRDSSGNRIVLSLRGCSKQGAFTDVSFDVREGEILGVGGLIGSGKSKLGRALGGLLKLDEGRISVNGHITKDPSPISNKGLGMVYVPPERKVEGIIDGFPVAWNISFPSGESGRHGFTNRVGWWSSPRENREAHRLIQELLIKGSPQTRAFQLSGGNQQKVSLAKWIRREPSLLILDNPTRGIDAGAKAEIYKLMRDLASLGAAIVLITDELLELIGMSNRILIMRDGAAVEMIEAPKDEKPTEQQLITLMIGASTSAAARNTRSD